MSEKKPHIAVVGAGAFGGWTALWLLRGGARVTLLDAWGAGNSRSSSGGETRVIRGLYGPDRIYTEWVARSFELWQEAGAGWGLRLYRPTGALWMFQADDSYARSSLPLLREVSLSVAELSLKEAGRRFPQIDFDGIGSVFFEERAGYLAARRACQAVAAAFVEEGGEFQELAVQPGPIRDQAMERVQLSDGSSLTADGYVFACGPWLGQLFPEVIGDRILCTRQEIYYFGTPAGDARFREGALPIWLELGEHRFYGIPGNESRGIKVADDVHGHDFDPTSGERTVTAVKLAEARRYLGRRFPALRHAPLVEARVCQYENSPDGHFLLDRHPQAANVWFAGGGSGHGFKLGPAVGQYVAELVLTGQEPFPQFAYARLAATPEGPHRSQFGDLS